MTIIVAMPQIQISKIVLASTNPGKLKEFKARLLDDKGNILGSKNKIEFLSISDVISEAFDVEETESSFLGNATLKAKAGSKLTGEYCLADDSGLVVEALDGRPGIYSGRYLKGEDLDEAEREENRVRHEKLVNHFIENNKSDNLCIGVYRLLDEMRDKDKRDCYFVCTLVLTDPNGEVVFKCEEHWHGDIVYKPLGVNGFGYDPIVAPKNYPEKYKDLKGKTVAELDGEFKAELSHRGQAIAKLQEFLK